MKSSEYFKVYALMMIAYKLGAPDMWFVIMLIVFSVWFISETWLKK